MKLYRYEEYCEKVNQIYQQLQVELTQLLPGVRIEHIGSSSIPGSISKGDLDVFLGVDSDKFEATVKLLCENGFTEKRDTFRSHELCMLITDKFNYDVAVQVVVNNSQFEDFLRFKQCLESDTKLVESYNQIKLSAQRLSADQYRAKKSQFIEEVFKKRAPFRGPQG